MDAPRLSFEQIAAELYTLAPADFTAARNERAADIRKADPQLAKRIRALHRPTQAAWAANLLAHRHPDVVSELLDLGRALRDAQERFAGERLRELVEQRRQLVRVLTARAVQDAAAAGHPLGAGAVADLDGTLSAALADPDAAGALAAGRLTAALEPVAWPGTAPGAPEAGAAAASRQSSGTDASSSARRSRPSPKPRVASSSKAKAAVEAKAERQRLREVERARAALAAAEQARVEAVGRAEAAERELGDAEAGQREAQAEAERTRAALAEARRRDARAREDSDLAGERVQAVRETARGAGEEAGRAREAVQRAADRLRELEGGSDRPGRD